VSLGHLALIVAAGLDGPLFAAVGKRVAQRAVIKAADACG
jgi:hypothetical protein